MSIHNDIYLRNLPREQLKALGAFLGWKVGSGMRVGDLSKEIDKLIKQRDGVLIITECGKEHRVNTTQEVSEIYVAGEKVYSK